jgi:hypothetical protein
MLCRSGMTFNVLGNSLSCRDLDKFVTQGRQGGRQTIDRDKLASDRAISTASARVFEAPPLRGRVLRQARDRKRQGISLSQDPRSFCGTAAALRILTVFPRPEQNLNQEKRIFA